MNAITLEYRFGSSGGSRARRSRAYRAQRASERARWRALQVRTRETLSVYRPESSPVGAVLRARGVSR